MQNRNARLFILIVWVLLGVFSASTPLHAQAWLGELAARISIEQRQALEASECKFGKALEEKNVAPSRNAAMLTMGNYWRAVGSGQSTLIAPFFDLRAVPIWSDRGAETIVVADSAVTDTYAKSKAQIAPTPIVFIRAGDDLSAAGRWIVRNAQNELVGIYDADFKPSKTGWLLTSLSLINKGEYLEPLVQYCRKRGDVIAARFSDMRTELEEAMAKTQKLIPQTEAALRSSFVRRTQAFTAPQDSSKHLLAEQAEAESDRLGRLLNDAANLSISKIIALKKLEREEEEAASIEAIWNDISK